MESKKIVKRKDGDYSYVSLVIPTQLKEKLDQTILEEKTSLTKFIIKTLEERVYHKETTEVPSKISQDMDALKDKMDLIIKLLAK